MQRCCFLCRQLALYGERGVKPRRIDAATGVSLALLPRLFQWRSALVVVRRQTVVASVSASAKEETRQCNPSTGVQSGAGGG